LVELAGDGLAEELHVGEVEQGGPVFQVVFVLAVAVDDADAVGRAEPLVDLQGREVGLLVAGRVGPEVAAGLGREHRPRGHQGAKGMVVERQPRLLAHERLEPRVEPEREALRDPLQRLPLGMHNAVRGRAAGAGAVGDDQGDPLIERPRQQGRLAAARVPRDGDVGGVHEVLRHEIVDHAVEAPGPHGLGRPVAS